MLEACFRRTRDARLAESLDIVESLTHPAVQSLLLGAISLVMVFRRRHAMAAWAGAIALAWVWFASTPALALALRNTLATTGPAQPPHADAIVVLGGETRPLADWSSAKTRAGKGLALWRAGYAPLLVVSGSDQARAIAEGYAAAGVPVRDIRVDARSRNTHENARDSAAILAASGASEVLLVTSATHMRRASAAFRKMGIKVWPEPTDETHAALYGAPGWLPRRDALTLTARCLYERIALWAYHLRGWI
ncbi:YdcF family protein [Luteibacter sp. Lutesp34]|uniref:YdcF family protein n=1 Tax=Luteibacter sp. Lutesp34 TaxID=3243030 RepID=UPI0039B5DA53